MTTNFKVDKEEVIDRLRLIKGVKAVKYEIPEIIPEEYESMIEILWEESDEIDEIRKGIEVRNEIRDLIGIDIQDKEIYIAVHVTQNKRIFNPDSENNLNIIEIE